MLWTPPLPSKSDGPSGNEAGVIWASRSPRPSVSGTPGLSQLMSRAVSTAALQLGRGRGHSQAGTRPMSCLVHQGGRGEEPGSYSHLVRCQAVPTTGIEGPLLLRAPSTFWRSGLVHCDLAGSLDLEGGSIPTLWLPAHRPGALVTPGHSVFLRDVPAADPQKPWRRPSICSWAAGQESWPAEGPERLVSGLHSTGPRTALSQAAGQPEHRQCRNAFRGTCDLLGSERCGSGMQGCQNDLGHAAPTGGPGHRLPLGALPQAVLMQDPGL